MQLTYEKAEIQEREGSIEAAEHNYPGPPQLQVSPNSNIQTRRGCEQPNIIRGRILLLNSRRINTFREVYS